MIEWGLRGAPLRQALALLPNIRLGWKVTISWRAVGKIIDSWYSVQGFGSSTSAGAYPDEATFKYYTLGYAYLSHKQMTRLEMLVRDKHSSLLRPFANYWRKAFYETETWTFSGITTVSGVTNVTCSTRAGSTERPRFKTCPHIKSNFNGKHTQYNDNSQ